MYKSDLSAKNSNTEQLSTDNYSKKGSPIKNGKFLPASISSVKTTEPNIILVLDYLDPNPCFTPGGPAMEGCKDSSYYLNNEVENIEITLSEDLKLFDCSQNLITESADNEPRGGTLVSNKPEYFNNFMLSNPNGNTYFFDIEGNKVKVIYQQCLP